MSGYITHKTVSQKPDGSHEFKQDLTRIYVELAAKQEPLGAEFEKVWMDNLEKLYEE